MLCGKFWQRKRCLYQAGKTGLGLSMNSVNAGSFPIALGHWTASTSSLHPVNTGSLYHNYKGTFSINLMALVDANYCFTFIDVGNYGSNADGTVFSKSEFGQLFLSHQLDIPGPKALPNAPQFRNLAHVIVADEAFPLKPNIMRPYPRSKNARRLSHPKQIYNYRLSRAHRKVENAFGILAQRWRCFNRRLQLKTKTVIKIVLAACVLHNYLQPKNDETSVATTYVCLNPERLEYLGIAGVIIDSDNLNGYRSAREAQRIRDTFRDYFVSPDGRLSFQDEQLRR